MSYETTLEWYAKNDPRDFHNLKKLIQKEEASSEAVPVVVSERVPTSAPAPTPSPAPSPSLETPIPLGYDIDGDGDIDGDDLKAVFNPADYGARKRWIPMALQIEGQRRRGGHYGNNGGLPIGLLVHWTAGHPDESMAQRASMAAETPYSYLCITDDGTLGQANPLTEKGKHAGAEKDGFPARADYYLVGCEISCPGYLKPVGNGMAQTYFPRLFPLKDCRKVSSKDNIVGGWYYKFTDAQEQTLFTLCLWLKWNDPEGFHFKNVRGHDETAEGRKVDPGGSLSMSMPEFRDALAQVWEQIKP